MTEPWNLVTPSSPKCSDHEKETISFASTHTPTHGSFSQSKPRLASYPTFTEPRSNSPVGAFESIALEEDDQNGWGEGHGHARSASRASEKGEGIRKMFSRSFSNGTSISISGKRSEPRASSIGGKLSIDRGDESYSSQNGDNRPSSSAVHNGSTIPGTSPHSHATPADSPTTNGSFLPKLSQTSTPSQPKPRLHAPPAIPHESNPVVAKALAAASSSSTSFASSSSSPTVTSLQSEPQLKPERKFILFQRHPRPSTSERNSIDGRPELPHPSTSTTSGPSKLEQVRSQTRPTYLPPKPKEEDELHLAAWETLMAQHQQHEISLQALQEKKRLEKERKVAERLPEWKNLIEEGEKMGWKGLRGLVLNDGKKMRMWFEGIPSQMRGVLWSRCIGNDLTLSKQSFRIYSSRAKKAIANANFPQDILHQIEEDSSSTLPATRLYTNNSPMQEELKDLLMAWYVSRVDHGLGYVRDVKHLAGMLLLTMNQSLAFVALTNMLDRSCLRAFYNGLDDETEAYYRIFENLQGELFPKIYANCKHLGVRLPSSYFSTLFLHQLSFEAACRVWDTILLFGDGHIFRVALAILAVLEPRLYFPDRQEIISILEGTNAASLAIIAREKERAKQKGLTYTSETDGVLTALGVDEQAIFDRLANDDWKESRFDRLSQRELPD